MRPEQEELDNHDDRASELTISIQRLLSTLSSTASDSLRRTLTRRLERLRDKLAGIQEVVYAIPEDRSDDDSVCVLEQYAEQITDVKVEMKDVGNCIFNIELTTDDPIMHK